MLRQSYVKPGGGTHYPLFLIVLQLESLQMHTETFSKKSEIENNSGKRYINCKFVRMTNKKESIYNRFAQMIHPKSYN